MLELFTVDTALKTLVTTVSFVFTGYFGTLLLSLIFVPLAGVVAHVGYPKFGLIVAWAPLPLALRFAVQSARTALRLEKQRQSKACKGGP